MINQKHIKNLIFETINDSKSNNNEGIFCYIIETQTFYESVIDQLIADDSSIIESSSGGLFWVAISGRNSQFNVSYVVDNIDPSNTDDTYPVGTSWYNYDNNNYWLCKSNNNGSAVWLQITNVFLLPTGSDDTANLLSYSISQKSSNKPIYFYDPNGIGFNLQNIDSNPTLEYNQLKWLGVNDPILNISGISNIENEIKDLIFNITDGTTLNILNSKIDDCSVGIESGNQNTILTINQSIGLFGVIIQEDRSPNNITATIINSDIKIGEINGLDELFINSLSSVDLKKIITSKINVVSGQSNININWGEIDGASCFFIDGASINLSGNGATIDLMNNSDYINIIGSFNNLSSTNGYYNMSFNRTTKTDGTNTTIISPGNISISGNGNIDPISYYVNAVKNFGVGGDGSLYLPKKINSPYLIHEPVDVGSTYNIDLSQSRFHVIDLTSTNDLGNPNPSLNVNLTNSSAGDEYKILIKRGTTYIDVNYVGSAYVFSPVAPAITYTNHYQIDSVLIADNNNILISRQEFSTGSAT